MDLLMILKVVSSVIGAFSVIATVTPNRIDNAVIDILLRVINVLGMNFGNSKNEVK